MTQPKETVPPQPLARIYVEVGVIDGVYMTPSVKREITERIAYSLRGLSYLRTATVKDIDS